MDIPIVQIDYSKDFDSIRNEIQHKFEDDLCERCDLVDFRIPIVLDNKLGYLKVMADFDAPICKRCPVPARLRYYFTIMINKRDQILVNGQLMDIGSLSSAILNYYENVGDPTGHFPENYEQMNFRFLWNQETEASSIEKILAEISKAHLTFVEQQVAAFCQLNKEELADIRNKYPLRIELDLGKVEKMKPALPPGGDW